MNSLFEAALEVQRFFEEKRWLFCFIGGLSVIRWGEPVATQDVDANVLTGFGGEEKYVGEILGRFSERVPDAAGFALHHRVLLVRSTNGIAVDIALGAIPFEELLVERSSAFAFLPGVELRTCSAEDLVVLKVFAARTKDWAAVEGILARQGDVLDWNHIVKQLGPLCELKGQPELLERLLQLRERGGRAHPTRPSGPGSVRR
jgi:hypothetical protein